jgi:hypothetical protein
MQLWQQKRPFQAGHMRLHTTEDRSFIEWPRCLKVELSNLLLRLRLSKASLIRLLASKFKIRLIYGFGTPDGETNPIAGPYYNVTIPEPLGVVGVIADEKESLLGLTRGLAPVITSGNTAVLIASERLPLSAISLAEVMATSDLPAGVVNILTGSKSELIPWLASHMEVDGIDISGAEKKLDGEIKRAGTENLKRIYRFEKDASLKRILSFMEYKTVWHPIGI